MSLVYKIQRKKGEYSRFNGAKDEFSDMCSICRENFCEMPLGSKSIKLPTCNHRFCFDCFAMHKERSSNSDSFVCPNCRIECKRRSLKSAIEEVTIDFGRDDVDSNMVVLLQSEKASLKSLSRFLALSNWKWTYATREYCHRLDIPRFSAGWIFMSPEYKYGVNEVLNETFFYDEESLIAYLRDKYNIKNTASLASHSRAMRCKERECKKVPQVFDISNDDTKIGFISDEHENATGQSTLASLKHVRITRNSQIRNDDNSADVDGSSSSLKVYNCDICGMHTNKSHHFEAHLRTKKHRSNTDEASTNVYSGTTSEGNGRSAGNVRKRKSGMLQGEDTHPHQCVTRGARSRDTFDDANINYSTADSYVVEDHFRRCFGGDVTVKSMKIQMLNMQREISLLRKEVGNTT